MTPIFQIITGAQNPTAAMADRLLSLELTDEDGENVDHLTITLDDRDERLAIPPMNVALDVALGYRETGLVPMGRFFVDGLSGEGPARSLTIRATAADMKSPIRAPKSRAWKNPTLAQIVQDIAGAAGLRPLVDEALGKTSWRYLAQTSESDLHFLARITRDLDATAKPTGGALIVQPRGAARTAGGATMPEGVIGPGEVAEWRWSRDGRKQVGKVEAEYVDPSSGKRSAVSTGQGAPVRRLRHPSSSAGDAKRLADAARRQESRQEMTLTLDLNRFAPQLVAGAVIVVAGVSGRIDGRWHLTRVTHRLAEGLTTSAEAIREASNATDHMGQGGSRPARSDRSRP